MSGLSNQAGEVVKGSLHGWPAGGSLGGSLTKSRECLARSLKDARTKRFSQDAGLMASLHLAKNIHGMRVDHFTVDDAVVLVAHEHQVVRIVSELGQEDRVAARSIGRVAHDVAM